MKTQKGVAGSLFFVYYTKRSSSAKAAPEQLYHFRESLYAHSRRSSRSRPSSIARSPPRHQVYAPTRVPSQENRILHGIGGVPASVPRCETYHRTHSSTGLSAQQKRRAFRELLRSTSKTLPEYPFSVATVELILTTPRKRTADSTSDSGGKPMRKRISSSPDSSTHLSPEVSLREIGLTEIADIIACEESTKIAKPNACCTGRSNTSSPVIGNRRSFSSG
jgi:hypothetical protein